MLVSFWNSSDRKSGVTTNAASVALFYAIRFKRRIALFENHVPSGMGLSDLLVRKRYEYSLFEEPMYYGKRNHLNYLYGMIKSGFPIKNISDSAIKLEGGRLHYFPQDSYLNHDLLDYELDKIIDSFLEILNERYDTVFVDLKQYNTMTTKRIIEKSNLIFLNLLYEDELIKDFFLNHQLDLDKIYFVFNKCCKHDKILDYSLIENYPIDSYRVSYLPYSDYFSRTCKNGNLGSFLKKNKWASIGQKPFGMMSELRKMTEYIKKISDENRIEQYEKIEL